MKRSMVAAGAVAILCAGPALAVEPELGARLGTSAAEIAAALAESGYVMTKYEREGDRIEVYAVRDDHRTEARIDAATGAVVATESRRRGGPWPLPAPDDDRIRAALEKQGYEVVTYERQRRRIEVYANRDGRRWELELDPRTGDVLRVEEED